ncbi:LLM class flavin-dependent oxidoreductase [Aeromicrobium sp. CTD01-1L150]|uniref:LLM class flavin-dependent oxidoreductase n=1 Tax=Aeromicrobium sp. CTD01-1L150 TaxID=3341830 RepID=UPI0035BED211
MQFWHFSECAYPDLPSSETYDSVRVTLPNGLIDPDRAADLWDRYIKEWQVADEAGLNIMVNEHHSTATCMTAAAPVLAAALSRCTTDARILILGNPVANRPDPVRIAEEMAMIDLFSRGRLDVGFVRGVQYEVSATNSKPVRMTERMWEAIELITQAWTSHDGPFNWEGEFFHHRQVNIWPRPYQRPTPPIWITAGTPGSVPAIADHGYKVATFLVGHEGARKIFQAYRDRTAELGRRPPSDDMFGYAALCYTGRTEEEGREGARKLLWYLQSNKVTQEFTFPPGYMPYFVRAAALRGPQPSESGAPALSPIPDLTSMSLDDLIDRGILFAGSAETVAGQIERFHDRVDGLGHLVLMGQAGHMDHEEAINGIRQFAEHVKPRLEQVTDGVPA